jgi:hypothetical protein
MKTVFKIYFILVTLMIPVLSYAPPGGSWNPGDTEPTVPLSGGLFFLIASAIFYGAKRLYDKRKDY